MAQIQENTDYMIVNYNSFKTWAVQNEDANDGTSIVQYDAEINPSQKNQRFRFISAGTPNLYYIVTNPDFGNFYITVDKSREFRFENNAGLNIYSYNSPDDIDFFAKFMLTSDDTGTLINIIIDEIGVYVDVSHDSTDNNAYVVIYEENSQPDQQWYILPYA